jgi:hypothetical protein
MDKSWSGFTGGKIRKEYRFKIVSTSNPGHKWPGFFYAWIMDNRKKEQATSNMRQGSG